MICKNCSAEFDDSVAQCPECGMENEAVTESFEEKNESDEAAQTVQENKLKQPEQEPSPDAAQEGEKESADEASQEKPREEKADEKKPEGARPVRTRPAPARRPVQGRPPQGRPSGSSNLKRRPIKPTKQEKRMIAVIMSLVCFIGLCAAAVAYLNITTDLLKVDTSTDKIVAGVGLTSAEEKQLEELLANCFTVAKNEFGAESTGTEAVLAKINPSDKGNIYSRVNNTSEKLQTTADPANRFADENGEYAYYKLSQKKVDAVLDCFGLQSYRGENEEDYYYCDGYYYYALETAESQLVKAEITKTRRILDGRYYAEFYFFTENDGKIKKSKTRYLVFEMEKNEATGKVSFAIEKTSSKNFVASDGKLEASARVYNRKTEVVEGYTKDGLLFCKYVIEYPVLDGEDAGSQNVNAIFENTVSVYRMKAESADADFKSFKKAGGEEEQLPYIENIVASVVFEDEKNISFAEKIYKLDPALEKETEEDSSYYYADAGQETEPEARLYDIAIESYTIDKQSGNFISKDSVVGKDYMLVSEVLYRIYKGYDYNSILPWNEEEYGEYYYDETPEDTDGYGAAIYDSAWSRTKSGISFWYKTVQGYVTEVTIPSKVAKKLAKIT